MRNTYYIIGFPKLPSIIGYIVMMFRKDSQGLFHSQEVACKMEFMGRFVWEQKTKNFFEIHICMRTLQRDFRKCQVMKTQGLVLILLLD